MKLNLQLTFFLLAKKELVSSNPKRKDNTNELSRVFNVSLHHFLAVVDTTSVIQLSSLVKDVKALH